MNFKIDAPRGIDSRIITREVKEEETARLKDEKGVTTLEVMPGFVKKCTLLIRNAGADYQPGDSFDVTASAYQSEFFGNIPGILPAKGKLSKMLLDERQKDKEKEA